MATIKSQKITNGARKYKQPHIDLKQIAAQEIECVKTEAGIHFHLATNKESKAMQLN